MAFLDSEPNFGQLLKRQRRAQFVSLLGKTLGALHNKYRRVPGVKMPVAEAQTGGSLMEQYLRGLQIKQLQQNMKAKQADRAKSVEREAAMQGALGLLGPGAGLEPGAAAPAVTQAPGALLDLGGVDPQVAATPALGLLNQPDVDPRRAAAARALASGGNYAKAIELMTPKRAPGPLSGPGKVRSDIAGGSLTEDQLARQRDLTRAQTTTNINTIGAKQETERQKAYGKQIGGYYGEQFTNFQTAGRAGTTEDYKLNRVDQLLDQAETGTFGDVSVKLSRAAESLGMDPKTWGLNAAAPGEAAIAITNELALGMRREMPGPMSDSDRAFLVQMQPGIGQTREGRKLLIKSRKKLNARKRQIAKMARDYQRKHGSLDAGFDDELAEWARANPLFDKSDMTALEAARLPSPKSAQERAALSPGTYYVDPSGSIRRAK